MSVPAFKIVEANGPDLKTLFHGIDGSRKLPSGRWLTAAKKMVKDGTSKTRYLSGFHILMTEADAERYLTSFSRRLEKLKIVRCTVRGEIRPKRHSRHPVFLADEIWLDY
jgi:hypothetical protein